MKNITIKIGIIAGLFLLVQNVGLAQSEAKTVETVEKKVMQSQMLQLANTSEVIKLDQQNKITDEQMPKILTTGEIVKVNAKACPWLYAVDEKGNIMWGENVDKKTRKKLLKKQRKELK